LLVKVILETFFEGLTKLLQKKKAASNLSNRLSPIMPRWFTTVAVNHGCFRGILIMTVILPWQGSSEHKWSPQRRA
tara:strand:+ start:2432 stop:2659 length:228 start_codon:yes stop_codon:yes gene_type:complete